jgi:tetratricopeptide (TPR) repeat protein
MAADDASRTVETYQQRVEEHPDSAAAHFNLGQAHTRRGRPGRAEECYRRALELDPDLVEAWVNLGGALLLKWDFRGSIAANEEALKRRDDLLLAHYNIGQARLYLGETDGVLKSYRRVVEIDPNHAAGHYYLAVGLLAAGRVQEASDEVARAKALGHSPAPDFLHALEKAVLNTAKPPESIGTTDDGAEAPDDGEENRNA